MSNYSIWIKFLGLENEDVLGFQSSFKRVQVTIITQSWEFLSDS